MSDNKAVNVSIIFIALVVLGIVLREFQSFMRPLALAVILMFLIMPVLKYSRGKKIFLGLSMVGIVLLLVLGVGLLGFLLSSEGEQVDEGLSQTYEMRIKNLVGGVQDTLSKVEIAGQPIDAGSYLNPDSAGKMITQVIFTIIQTAGSIFSELMLAIIFLIFLIPSNVMISKELKKNMGSVGARKFNRVMKETGKSMRDYLYTKSLVSLFTAVVSMIILFIFRADFVMILGVIFFIFNFIPNIGSIAAVVFAVLAYALKFGLGWNVVFLAVLLTTVQFIIGSYIEPKYAGQKLKLSPIVIILSLFIWYWIWGILGMILAVPLTSMIKIILSNMDSTKRWVGVMG